MDKQTALAFLRQHQPMPPDEDERMEALIQQYDEIRLFFKKHPDPECIPLFFNSFGQGDGLGVYPLVGFVLESFTKEQALPHLLAALESEHDSVRTWCCQMAMTFAGPEIIPALTKRLKDPNAEVREWAVSALAIIEAPQVESILETAIQTESDPQTREAIKEELEWRHERARENPLSH